MTANIGNKMINNTTVAWLHQHKWEEYNNKFKSNRVKRCNTTQNFSCMVTWSCSFENVSSLWLEATPLANSRGQIPCSTCLLVISQLAFCVNIYLVQFKGSVINSCCNYLRQLGSCTISWWKQTFYMISQLFVGMILHMSYF